METISIGDLLNAKIVCLASEGKHASCRFLSMLTPNFWRVWLCACSGLYLLLIYLQL